MNQRNYKKRAGTLIILDKTKNPELNDYQKEQRE